MMAQVKAPWTNEQVGALRDWQRRHDVHPFTCPNRQERGHRKGVLLPTQYGWVCQDGCGYTQDWAHDFMLEPTP